MRFRRSIRIAVVAMAVTAAIFAAVRIADSTADNKRREANAKVEEHFEGITAEVNGTELCEVIVDIGRVPYSATATKLIRITNCSEEPLVLVDYTTQCRCMWLEFNRKPIAAGESTDIELYFDSRGEWGSVGNYMEITTSRDTMPIVLWIAAKVE